MILSKHTNHRNTIYRTYKHTNTRDQVRLKSTWCSTGVTDTTVSTVSETVCQPIGSSCLQFAIVGTGPAGIYTAKALARLFPQQTKIHFYEKSLYPYGLLRYGIAPDHPQLRLASREFDLLCSRDSQSSNIRFFNGVTVLNCPDSRASLQDPPASTAGPRSPFNTISLNVLRKYYDAVVLCTGSECPLRLNIPSSHLGGITTGNHFLRWCNGFTTNVPWDQEGISSMYRSVSHPEPPHVMQRFIQQSSFLHGITERLHPFTPKDPHVLVVGLGNVALDVARLLLRDLDSFTAPSHVKSVLSSLNVSRVTVMGRKPLIANRFSPSQLREVLRLPNIKKTRSPRALQCPPDASPRARKVSQLLQNIRPTQEIPPVHNTQSLHFLGTSQPFIYRSSEQNSGWVSSLEIVSHELSSETINLPVDLVIECLGYTQPTWFESPLCTLTTELPFKERNVICGNGKTEHGKKLAPVYFTGWCNSDVKGPLSHTILDATRTADTIKQHFDPLV